MTLRTPRHGFLPLSLGATCLALLAACASTAEPNATLDQARSRLGAAQRQPQTAALANDELVRARSLLRRAEQARIDGEKPERVTHLAYLSLQQVAIAEDTATGSAAQAVLAGAAAERDRMRLTVRTQEASEARTQQSMAEADSAAKTAQLARAEADTRAERDRVARRDRTVTDLESQLRDMNARFTDRGAVVTLGDLQFDTGDAHLRPGGQRRIDQLAAFLRNAPQRHAAIEGYTDSVGSAQANQALSDRRAHAVMAALIELGVSAEQLSTQAFGEERPVASNGTAAGRQMNRRVEVVFARDRDERVSQ